VSWTSHRDIITRSCPDCAAHLDDTWDEDAGECQNCGFAYVRVEPARKTTTDRSTDPGPSMTAATLGLMLAWLGGAELPRIVVNEAAAGAVSIDFTGGNFILALALCTLGILLIGGSATWRATR
jgi:Zn ribbon nucleic-acid-binding protein